MHPQPFFNASWHMDCSSAGPSMSNVVSLKAVRELKKTEDHNPEYREFVASLDKVRLLEEMVRYQEERAKIGHLTLDLMVRGKILFSALEQSAETQELKLLTGSYRRHLEFEMKEYARGPEQYLALARAEAAEDSDSDGPELDFESQE